MRKYGELIMKKDDTISNIKMKTKSIQEFA